MIKRYGIDLFLPEGDDYSKTEFDQHQEEMNAEGQAVLNRLRMEAEMARAASEKPRGKDSGRASGNTNASSKIVNTLQRSKAESDEKLSYKDMLEKAVARK